MTQVLNTKDTRLTTTEQMSLALFDEMFSTGREITDSSVDIGFRRNNMFIDVADLGMAARRAVDTAFFIVSQTPEIQKRYEVDTQYFRWLMRYESWNLKHLRRVLREAQKAAIQVTNINPENPEYESDDWISVPLMGPVGMSGGRTVFEVHEVLQAHVKNQRNSHFLNLRVTASFTLLYARAIYDHLLPFVDEGTTDWILVEDVYGWPGRSEGSPKEFEFKYFKRDSLEPAKLQINAVSDINIAYETRRSPQSRKITWLRFHVTRKAGPTAEQALLGSATLYNTLRNEFGLSPKNLDEIIENQQAWSEDRIHQAIEFTRWYLDRGKISKSLSGFFMKALRDSLRISDGDRKIAAQQAQLALADADAAKAKALEPERHQQKLAAYSDQAVEAANQQADEGMAYFDTLDAAAKQAAIAEFGVWIPAKPLLRRKKVSKGELTEEILRADAGLTTSFGQFIQQRQLKR